MVRKKYNITNRPQHKTVRLSKDFKFDLSNLVSYTYLKFGKNVSDDFTSRVSKSLDNLSTHYLTHSECRFLQTKSKMYRTIPIKRFSSILYRIKPTTVDVLAIYPNARATATFVRNLRRIKI